MDSNNSLRTLSMCHYVVAALHLLVGSAGLVFLILGASFVFYPSAWQSGPDDPVPPPEVGMIFIVIGIITLLLGIALALVTALSGMYIAARVRRTFSLVVAGINCTVFPFGLVLGIFDFILLSSEQARAEYAASAAEAVTTNADRQRDRESTSDTPL